MNLATRAGAIARQAQDVLELVFKKNNLYSNRWLGRPMIIRTEHHHGLHRLHG